MIFDAPNLNRCWADLIVEACVRGGVNTFFVAPGSRSTPLTTAAAAHPQVRTVVHVDERGTAFAALGYGRATGRPAAWITTSGTALANGYPAVLEASQDEVPMLLLTADRPPELRHTGANQTLDQVHLYGRAPRWFFDLPAPTVEIPPAFVLTTVAQALHRASAPSAGPVHLNSMFREPLAPTPDGVDVAAYLAPLKAWHTSDRPYTTYAAPRQHSAPTELAHVQALMAEAERGWLLAGPMPHPADHEAAMALAETLGWPLWTDVGSGLRLGQGLGSPLVPYADLLTDVPSWMERHAPDVVLHLGRRLTAKRLGQALQRHRPRHYITVHPSPERLDPTHQVTFRLQADIRAFCEDLAKRLDARSAGHTAALVDAAQHVDTLLTDRLDGEAPLSEPSVARLLTRLLPTEQALVLSSSMPIRDVDLFGALGGARVPVYANRGVSGIDGLVATAAGVGLGHDGPITLLIGDLALLHDLNALALLRHLAHPAVLVVINNDGGGIFHFLPIAEAKEVFEPYFGTPHGYTFEGAAQQFGLRYEAPSSLTAFAEAYQGACAASTSTLIEVRTDRTATHALHASLRRAVRDLLR
ncbi:MAG: 2-succinyl-5-enolpyruvyl-6-hydroxy-3-cyclohexene-1-carboxylic-acid synthase [Bacteroidota bacterium]